MVVIKREDIKLIYTGDPDRGLMLEAYITLHSRFTMSEDQDENLMESQAIISQIFDTAYCEIRESLYDILEEYQMRHGGHKAGQNKLQGMIEELIDRIPK